MRRVGLATVIVVTQVAALAAQQATLQPVTVGDLSFEIKPRVGPVIQYRGLTLLEGAYLRFHSPDWRTTYLSASDRFWASSDTRRVEEMPGEGKRIVLTGAKRNGIELRLVYEIPSEGRLDITAEYSYDAGGPPCNLEYGIALLPPGPYAGQRCVFGAGASCVLPIIPRPGPERFLFKAADISFFSRLGKVRFSAIGEEPEEFTVADWRNYAHNMRLESFVLIRSASVQPGGSARLRTAVEFSPDVPPPAQLVTASAGVGGSAPPAPPAYDFPLIPTPKTVAELDGVFDCGRTLRLVGSANTSARERSFLLTLAADIEGLLGARPEVVVERGEAASHPSAWVVAAEEQTPQLWGPSLDGQWDRHEEGYAVEMRPNAIALAGADAQGLWYATRMVYQVLANAHDENPRHPQARRLKLTNWPDHQIRGMHIPLRRSSDLGFLEQVIRCLGLYHYNLLIFEVHDAVRYDDYPLGSAPGAYEKETVRRLVDLGRRNGLEVVPGINSLGHAQDWLFQPYRLDRLSEFKDLIEDSSRPELRRQRTLCPSNPRVYELLFGIHGELLELFDSRRFFVGLDEAFDWAECPRCRGKRPAVLFADHINKLNDHFRKRNVEMIMFQDMFLEKGDWPRGVPSNSHDTAPAIDLIPRENILMCCWQYTPDTEYPAFSHFVDRGFKCVGASWFQSENIWGYARYVKAHGGQGMIGTTWTPHGWGPGRWQMRTERSRLAAYVRGGDAYWSCDLPATAPKDEGYDADVEIERHYARHATDRRVTYTPLDINRWRNWGLNDTVAGDRAKASFDYGPEHDLSCLIRSAVGMGGVPFEGLETGKAIALRGAWEPNIRAPVEVEGIVVGRRASAIVFLHTCGWEVTRGTPIARYTMHFEDGANQVQDILYGRDILAFDSDYFMYDELDPNCIWPSLVGRTRIAQAVRFHAFRWANHRPDVGIRSLDLASLGTIASPIMLAITTEDR